MEPKGHSANKTKSKKTLAAAPTPKKKPASAGISKPRKKRDPDEGQKKRARKLEKIKDAFENGKIKDFSDIFDIMDRTPFGTVIGMQNKPFLEKLKDPSKFTFKDAIKISDATKVDYDLICSFIANLVKSPVEPGNNRSRPKYINKH